MAIAFRSVLMSAKVSGSKVVVTCDPAFAGKTISCTKSGTTLTQICPSTSPYTVTFEGLESGTWTISGTIQGQTFSTTAEVQDVSCVLSYGFVWTTWVDTSSQLDSTNYNTLDELLEDEEAVRELMLEHACVDYMASFNNVTPNLEKIIENDLAAKWINLSDYALDVLYANTTIKGYMDTAGKYGYGEWVITDNTTTPPTWGPKGNVPVMTANNTPYGTASAYQVFDRNASTTASGTDFSYKFTNPICPKSFYCNVSGGTLQASNDGSTWATPTSGNYYLYLRLHFASSVSPHTIQFYGRELSVSVPTMTSNTTPYGEVSGDEYNSTTYACWKAYNGSTGVGNMWLVDGIDKDNIYKFPSAVMCKAAQIRIDIGNGGQNLPINFAIEASNDGSNWTTLVPNASCTAHGELFTFNFLSNTTKYLYYKVRTLTNMYGGPNGWSGVSTIQFYGLDYSEKEFEVGTTKKWLYDHGLELVDFGSPIVSGSAIAEKQANQFYGKVVTGGQNSFAFAPTDAVDLTDYDLLMARAGDKFTVGNSAFTPFLIGVKATRTYSYLDDTMLGDSKKGLPLTDLVLGLDISSINQSAYPMYADSTSGGKRSGTIKEIWLE